MFRLTSHSSAVLLDHIIIVITYYYDTPIGSIVQHVKRGAVTSPDNPLVTKAVVRGNHHPEVMVASKSTLKHTSFSDPNRRGWERPSGMGGCTQRCHPRGATGTRVAAC